jgi:hypothetical protein
VRCCDLTATLRASICIARSVLVVGIMQHNPLSGGLFVFINKRRNN